jgi:phage tail sheath gpL-like
MDISFSTVPDKELIPGLYIETAADNPALPNQNTLIIGQTKTGQPNLPVFISSAKTAVKQFGSRSQLASMVQSYLAADLTNVGVWVLPYADAGGSTAATGSISITGTATAAGTLFFYVGGRYIPVAVASGDTGATVATNVAAAFQAYVDSSDTRIAALKRQKDKHRHHRFFVGCQLPLTAAINGSTATQVDLTASNKGTAGNGIDVQLNYLGSTGQEVTPPGLTVAITQLSGGAVDPDISGLDAILVNTPYDFIVIPWNTTTQLNSMQTFLSTRWAANRDLWGGCFAARRSSGSNGNDASTFGLTRNDPHTLVVHYEPGMPPPEWDVAAVFAGAFAQSSRSDPGMPTHNLALPVLLGPHRDKHFADNTRAQLLGNGCALMKYEADHSCRILRAVTTSQFDENGAPDQSYLDMETNYLLMAVNRTLRGDYLAAFPRAKLADDGTTFGPGSQFTVSGLPRQPIATPKSIKATFVASYQRMEKNKGWVTDSDYFAQNVIVQRRSTDPSRIDVIYPVTLIGGLRVTAVMNLFQLQAAQ